MGILVHIAADPQPGSCVVLRLEAPKLMALSRAIIGSCDFAPNICDLVPASSAGRSLALVVVRQTMVKRTVWIFLGGVQSLRH